MRCIIKALSKGRGVISQDAPGLYLAMAVFSNAVKPKFVQGVWPQTITRVMIGCSTICYLPSSSFQQTQSGHVFYLHEFNSMSLKLSFILEIQPIARGWGRGQSLTTRVSL